MTRFDTHHETHTVTVVVGRTARPGASGRRIRRWLENLIERGSRAQGYVRGAPAVLIVNIAGVVVLSWILLPPLTQRFKRWLRR